ncbi:MAG: hypothetical protein H6Q73_4331 [Firmicutes bacterium]|nr:hypothetical protein [Bacillota bacterium]
MQTKLYAAYGSNMNLSQMKKRCPKARVVGKGDLLGYKLTFRGTQSGVANVEVINNGKVPVVLWAITNECEKSLDRYEGFPTLYTKKLIEVETPVGTEKVMVYVMTRQYESKPALPNEYYFATISQGYQDNGIDIAFLQEALERCKAELEIK